LALSGYLTTEASANQATPRPRQKIVVPAPSTNKAYTLVHHEKLNKDFEECGNGWLPYLPFQAIEDQPKMTCCKRVNEDRVLVDEVEKEKSV
jgi:hypothetical protein